MIERGEIRRYKQRAHAAIAVRRRGSGVVSRQSGGKMPLKMDVCLDRGNIMQGAAGFGPETHTQYSFWIVPAEPLRKQLHSRIRQLAAEYDAIDFDPHVTIYSGMSSDEEARVLAGRVAGLFTAFELALPSLDYAASYTKALFIRLNDTVAARRIFDAISQGSGKPSDYVLDPHLSLLYKTLPATTLAGLCQTVEIPRGSYLFDRLRVIETEIPLTRPEQVARWRTVHDFRLGA